jgi:hypothetical protein
MKPWIHAISAAHKWGGIPDDYIAIEDFLDCSKAAHADMRHRAVLHNSIGPYIAEQCFGHNITNSDGKTVSVRDICEQHIIEDLDRIPSLSQWLSGMPMYWWMGGTRKKNKEHSIVD